MQRHQKQIAIPPFVGKAFMACVQRVCFSEVIGSFYGMLEENSTLAREQHLSLA
jgi:hypothetical protein